MAAPQQVKKGNYLDHLTKGLYDAVVQAQALAENQHIESLGKYVNKDGTPKCMEMVINNEKVNIPLATLAPQSSIKIKELTMDLKVKLNNFGKRKSKSGGGIFKKRDAGAVSVDLGSSILPSKNN